MQYFVILSIDTEFSTHKDNLGIWYEINGERYGLRKILAICQEYGIKATFFVDVYQKEREIRKACDQILEQDHEIQLHTHPNWCFDQNRQNLACYNLEEQCEIIAYGKRKLLEWTGIAPMAHRAGDFGADENTLQALEKNEIFSDFSYYWDWPDCKVSRKFNLRNQVTWIKSILEVPVTCFYMPGFNGFVKYRLVDINEPFFLLKHLFQEFKSNLMRTIVITLHSFSFIGYNERKIGKYAYRQLYWPLKQNIKKFHKLLNLIRSDNSFQCVTASEFYKIAQKNIDIVQNPVDIPTINPLRSILWQGNKLLSKSYNRIFQHYHALS